MSMKKLEEMTERTLKELCGLCLKKGEKGKLHELCVKYGIPITYPSLFADDTHYYLWGIKKNGIGLISTVIMNCLSENNGKIVHSLEELEEYLKGL